MSTHVHSLNMSPAHQKYSFGKGRRFIYDKPRYNRYNKGLMYIIGLKAKKTVVQLLLATEKDRLICQAKILILHMLIRFLLPFNKREAILLRQAVM